jgi:hypothetical protein
MAQVVWDEMSDPNDPGWVVLTETAGWQRLGGDIDDYRYASDQELQEQARKTLAWHDGTGAAR